MPLEIERKFLVRTARWTPAGEGRRIIQAYLPGTAPGRVRLSGEDAWITFKGPPQDPEGRVRREDEFPIPPALARLLLDHSCRRPFIEKTRRRERHGGREWEIDAFHAENEGLVLAEVELPEPDAPVDLPPWAGREVTGDPRFTNYGLSRKPWTAFRNEFRFDPGSPGAGY